MTEAPTKCKHCDHEVILQRVIETINNEPCEIEYSCEKCFTEVAYWAYGSFEPEVN